MSNLRTAAQQALAILEFPTHYSPTIVDKAIDALRAAITQSDDKAQPMAWIEHHKAGDNLNWERVDYPYAKATPLFAAPQPPVEQSAELSDDKAFLEWITDTLIELNPSNYDHDDACQCSAASVEVILAIQKRLADRAARGG